MPAPPTVVCTPSAASHLSSLTCSSTWSSAAIGDAVACVCGTRHRQATPSLSQCTVLRIVTTPSHGAPYAISIMRLSIARSELQRLGPASQYPHYVEAFPSFPHYPKVTPRVPYLGPRSWVQFGFSRCFLSGSTSVANGFIFAFHGSFRGAFRLVD